MKTSSTDSIKLSLDAPILTSWEKGKRPSLFTALEKFKTLKKDILHYNRPAKKH